MTEPPYQRERTLMIAIAPAAAWFAIGLGYAATGPT